MPESQRYIFLLFGDPEALEYMTDMILGFLDDMRIDFYLKGLEAEATYVVRNADTDETHEFTGEQLMTKGLNVYFPRVQVSHMIYFDKK